MSTDKVGAEMNSQIRHSDAISKDDMKSQENSGVHIWDDYDYDKIESKRALKWGFTSVFILSVLWLLCTQIGIYTQHDVSVMFTCVAICWTLLLFALFEYMMQAVCYWVAWVAIFAVVMIACTYLQAICLVTGV